MEEEEEVEEEEYLLDDEDEEYTDDEEEEELEEEELVEEANNSNRNFDFVQWNALAEQLQREYEVNRSQRAMNHYIDVYAEPSSSKKRRKFMRRNTLTCDGRERLPAETISLDSGTVETVKVPNDALADACDSVVMARAFQKAKAWKERKVNKNASLSYIDFPGVSPKAVELATGSKITRRRSLGCSIISNDQADHLYFHKEHASPVPPMKPTKTHSFDSSSRLTGQHQFSSEYDALDSVVEEEQEQSDINRRTSRRVPPASIADSVQMMRERSKHKRHSSQGGLEELELEKGDSTEARFVPPASIVDSVQLARERGKQKRRNSGGMLETTQEEPGTSSRFVPPASIADSVQMMRERSKHNRHSSQGGLEELELEKGDSTQARFIPPASIVDSVQLARERGKQKRRNSGGMLETTQEEPGTSSRFVPPASIADSVQMMRERSKDKQNSCQGGLVEELRAVNSSESKFIPPASIVDSVQLARERGKQKRRNSGARLQSMEEEPARPSRSRQAKANIDLDESIDIYMLQQMSMNSGTPGSSRWMTQS